MTSRRSSEGFVLIFSLVLALCAGVILAGTIGYVSYAARQSAAAAARSSCRLAAMSALEKVKDDVYRTFKARNGNRSVLGVRVYDWFTTGWSATAIGSGGYRVDFNESVNQIRPNLGGFTDLRVRLRSAPVNVGNRSEVTFFATAARMTGNGVLASVTLAERVSFGVDRSKVFDYAYFVNNYGWFEGSTITANGAVRANGDMSLSQSPKVNGDVYAARNDELNVPGDIKNGTGTMDNKSTYRSTQYGTANRSRPLQVTHDDGGYNAPATVTSADLTARLHGNLREGLDMPWISGLNEYIEYGKELKSTLSQGGTYYINNANSGDQNYGYYQGTGPSGDPELPDNHALVLEGTQTNPIRINGPVVVSNDVVIKGYVTGQGTIYSSRNIHIVGDIKYVNPPNWANKEAASGNGNSTKDLLCLAAKGNIVMGDCTAGSSWLDNTLRKVLTQQPYVQPYACAQADDGSWIDGDIGYPRAGKTVFEGNYTAADGGKKVGVVYKKDKYGRTTTEIDHYTSSSDRRYYDSVVPPNEIANRAKTAITQIDAVLYNNHGIFGRLGQCTINGSLVCRNEGMIFSGKLYLNWDYRLYSGSPENVMNQLVGMPLGTGQPVVLSWQEVPDDWNADAEASSD
ncbi:MAG: hypothetical protein IJL17_01700 [Kiritimatiellae bacterium]|nr:hypothetical protein [Kiritimatiellia bacterium]